MERILKSAKAARTAFVSGTVTAEEIARAILDRIDASRSQLRIFRDVFEESALREARCADSLRARGGAPGPLAGLCIAVKENCDVEGAEITAGMRGLIGRRAQHDSWIVDRLRMLGATVIGTTISDPGAFGVVTREVTHPAGPGLSVGGSSGGSAAALAAGLCHGAIGTDTGGSIRIPSALCGTAGLKPAFGRSPLQGVWPLVPSLDHVGPMARDAEDLALLNDALDPLSREVPSPPASVGFDPAWLGDCSPEVASAFADQLRLLEAAGIALREVRLPELDRISQMHSTIFCTETAAFYRAFLPNDFPLPQQGQGALAYAETLLMTDYLAACRLRQTMRRQVDEILMEEVDLVLSPVTMVAHHRKEDEEITVGGRSHSVVYGLVRLTCLFNHTGHPAAALPLSGCSMQIVAPPSSTKAVFALPLPEAAPQF